MTDLILKARLGSLESNFKALSHTLESIKNRRNEIRQLEELLKYSRKQIRSLSNSLSRSCGTIEDFSHNHPFLSTTCRELDKYQKEDVPGIRETITEALVKIKEIQDRYVNLKHNPESELNKIMKNYNDKVIKRISKDLEDAANAENEAKAEEKRKNAWKKYADKDQMLNRQHIFEEYVDFLRGLAMRDADLDEGICRIADDLTSGWSWLPTKLSLTIPASREPAYVTLARFIHLGFPEWSLWALPLIAHEIGHGVVRNSKDLSQFLEENAPEKKYLHWEEFMVDAFATVTMGPAYAFACILLRFEPPSAYEDKQELPADAKRAQIIFKILKINMEETYSEIEKLEEEWNTALEQANETVKKLTQDDENQLNKFVSSLKEKDLLEELTSVKYPTKEVWARTQVLKKDIFDNLNRKPDDFQVSSWDFKLRDVLNAAWLCRVEKLEKTDDIHKAARTLWRILEAQRVQPIRGLFGTGQPSTGAGIHQR